MTANKNNVKIHIENLKKSFGHNKVLQGISTDIYEGEVVCVIGPSGSGKSTFLRCINRLETATSGEIVVDGHRISDKKINLNKVQKSNLITYGIVIAAYLIMMLLKGTVGISSLLNGLAT